jgi:serine/threonine-protein kinase
VTPERFQKIESLVSLAQERQPTERSRFLAEACAGDDDLRQRVEAMLQAHQHLDSFLVHAPPALVAEALQAEDGEVSAQPSEPLVLNDRYIIERELGRGGMGRVLVAQDAKLNRKVAIKFLVTGMHDEQALRRFEQEARAAGSLNHPNVLVIYDAGLHQGRPYIISELLEGDTLRGRLAGTPLPISAAVDYAVQLAEGLAAAHAKGIVHRDLKPENLFITEDGRLKILDFGIAKLTVPKIPSGNLEEPLQTQPGAILGTIGYLSPEQIRGEPADERSDLFSAGLILYEMFSGKRAFQEASPLETAYAILNAEPSELPAQVTATMKEIIRHCLKKGPEERFQSARELGVQLRAAANELSLRSVLNEYQAPSRRNDLGQISSIAALPFVNLSGDPSNEYFSDGLTEELINALAKVEDLRVAARTSAFQFKGKNSDVREIGRRLGVAAVLEGSVRKEGDSLRITAQLISTSDGYHLWSETYDREMTQVFAIQEDISRAIVETLKLRAAEKRSGPLVTRHTEHPEAHDLYLRGRYFWNKRGQEGAKKSIQYFQQAIEKDPHYAPAYAGLADAYLSLAFSFDAGTVPPGEAAPRAKAAALKALELDDRLAPAHISLAFVCFLYEWDWNEAEKQFQRALALDPRYPHTHHWYSHYLLALGRVEESLAHSKRALELDPLDAILNTHMGWHHLYSHQYELAIEHLRNALEMDPNNFHSQRELGRAYAEKGWYREAVSLLRKALRQAKGDGFAQAGLGYAYATWGKSNEARRSLEHLRRLSPRRYISPYFPAAIHAGLGEKEMALEQLERAYEERSDALVYLKVEPMFSSLRSLPRFKRLVQRMGL